MLPMGFRFSKNRYDDTNTEHHVNNKVSYYYCWPIYHFLYLDIVKMFTIFNIYLDLFSVA